MDGHRIDDPRVMDGTNAVPPRLRYKRLPKTFTYDPDNPNHFERQWDDVPRDRTTAFTAKSQDASIRETIEGPCV